MCLLTKNVVTAEIKTEHIMSAGKWVFREMREMYTHSKVSMAIFLSGKLSNGQILITQMVI